MLKRALQKGVLDGQGRRQPRLRGPFVLLLVLAMVASGCKSPQEYATLAEAGTAYVTALDRLLVVSGEISIDATSEKLLANRELGKKDIQSYRQLSQGDVDRQKIIGELRQHVRLLKRYFELLHDLATSDAPSRTQEAIGGVADSLSKVGSELRDSSIVSNKDVFKVGAGLLVGGIIRSALREELSQRQAVIQEELKTQEELLKALAGAIEQDLSIAQEIREKRLVLDPFVAAEDLRDIESWKANRKSLLTTQMTVKELGIASEAVKNLREAFGDLVSGKLTLARVKGLVDDFGSILEFVEALQGKRGEKK